MCGRVDLSSCDNGNISSLKGYVPRAEAKALYSIEKKLNYAVKDLTREHGYYRELEKSY